VEGHSPSILLDVTVALAIAFVGGWLAMRLRLSPIVGYVAAGLVISPFTPGFVGDTETLRLIADFGVVLLLFGIGIHFSLSELLVAGPKVILGASAQTMLVLVVAWFLGLALGWRDKESLYIGAAAAITSSVVLVKLLESRGDVSAGYGRLAVVWSIVQDLWGVVLIVGLGAISGEGSGNSAGRELALAVAKAFVFVGVLLLIGLRVVPAILARVAAEQPRELFYLAIAVLALGTALISDFAGLSLALGAFLAGLVVSESEHSHRVVDALLPTREVFAVLFFVSVGMLIDPKVVRDEWATILTILVLILIVKSLFGWTGLRLFNSWQTATLATAALVPAGEFSFLIAKAGLDSRVLSDEQFGAIITAAAMSAVASTLIFASAHLWMGPNRVAAVQAPPSLTLE